MKKKYFKFIEIDKAKLALFLEHHPKMKKFIDGEKPFYVRVGLKPYPTLLHHAIFDDLDSKKATQIAANLEFKTKKIKPKYVNQLDEIQLLQVTDNNHDKAKLIRTITNDVISKRLDLKKLAKEDTTVLIHRLSYLGLSINTLKQFAIFGCYKQDVWCMEDEDFVKGLRIYANKKNLTKRDINDIKQEYSEYLTLFSLCMWRIVNEGKK